MCNVNRYKFFYFLQMKRHYIFIQPIHSFRFIFEQTNRTSRDDLIFSLSLFPYTLYLSFFGIAGAKRLGSLRASF